MIKQHKFHSIALSAMLLAGTTVVSAAQPLDKGFYIGPSVGYYFFDENDDNNADDAFLYGLGIGYQFSRRFALEATYSRLISEAEQTSLDVDNINRLAGSDVDLDMYRLDALFGLDFSWAWSPYIAMGYTRLDQDPQFGQNEDMIDVGLGIKGTITPALSLRGDVRAFFEGGDTDYGVNLGLFYLFGKAPPPPPPPKPAITKTIVVPEPEPVDPCTLDSDGDGVNNCDDICPGTEAGDRVDNTGCRIIEVTKSIELELQFKSGKSVVRQADYPEVEKVADFMREYSQTVVEIQGHTDSRGRKIVNKKLSQKRANAVRDVLITQFGIDASRVTAVGYGEEDPIADNRTAEGRQLNRRVVAKIETVVEEVEGR